jgi:hypothetical protein
MVRMTRVVHCKKAKYDVYIGRGRCPQTGYFGSWGNPFEIGKDGTREEVIGKYREWILQQPKLLEMLPQLKDKVLGCWCVSSGYLTAEDKPWVCHGQVLAELCDKLEAKSLRSELLYQMRNKPYRPIDPLPNDVL